jgi:hypothetical protein
MEYCLAIVMAYRPINLALCFPITKNVAMLVLNFEQSFMLYS